MESTYFRQPVSDVLLRHVSEYLMIKHWANSRLDFERKEKD